MMNTAPKVLLPICLALTSACGAFATDVNANVSVAFTVENDESTYRGIESVDPNENQDVQDNRDAITGGRVTDIDFEILEQFPGNMATEGSATVFARLAGEEWPTQPDFSLPTVSLAPGSRYNIELTQAQIERLSGMVFPEDGPHAIELMIQADANGNPNFRAQLVFSLEATVDPLETVF